jgi:hypothetical protein
MTAPLKHPANQPFALLKKLTEKQVGFGGPASAEDMARVRAEMPELMADLRRRRNSRLQAIDNGEQDYDGDLGREHADLNDRR